jgi:hypothetical protein
MKKRTRKLVLFTSLALASFSVFAAQWRPAAGPLMTRWSKDVSPANVLPEYPRPQLVRAAVHDHQEHQCHFIGKFLRERKPSASVLDEIFR